MTSPKSPDVDYRVYTEGKLEPYHGKTIKHLIAKHKDYLVYLDEDLYVWWSIKDSYKPEAVTSASFGEVLNRVSLLEAIEVSNLSERQVAAFRRMLGEAVARLLDTQNPEQSQDVLNSAFEYITQRNSESARVKYLFGSFGATIVVLICIAIIWIFRETIALSVDASHIILGMAAGALGALMSILLRLNNVTFDTSASAHVYYAEGAAKIIAGMIGALLIAVGILGKFILGNLSNVEFQLPAIVLLGLIAGASERLVPGILRKMENQSLSPEATMSKKLKS